MGVIVKHLIDQAIQDAKEPEKEKKCACEYPGPSCTGKAEYKCLKCNSEWCTPCSTALFDETKGHCTPIPYKYRVGPASGCHAESLVKL